MANSVSRILSLLQDEIDRIPDPTVPVPPERVAAILGELSALGVTFTMPGWAYTEELTGYEDYFEWCELLKEVRDRVA